MRKFMVAGPLVFAAAVLLSVYALGSGTSKTDAACMGDSPEVVSFSGRAGSSEMFGFDFCSDETLMLAITVQWSNGKKDLALSVTDPTGAVQLVDHSAGTSEGTIIRAPLTEGSWSVEVINNGKGSVAYTLTFAFVEDPAF